MAHKNELSPAGRADLLTLLQERFDRHPEQDPLIDWADVQHRLQAAPGKLQALYKMEQTGGDPALIGKDEETGEYLFADCAAESPSGRRSLCYDREARETRKKYPPESSAIEMAKAMGVELLTEEQYRQLQQSRGPLDTKTSSWLQTPPAVRTLGGALFGDYRYGRTFIYHNGVQSYYAARGFRALLRV